MGSLPNAKPSSRLQRVHCRERRRVMIRSKERAQSPRYIRGEIGFGNARAVDDDIELSLVQENGFHGSS